MDDSAWELVSKEFPIDVPDWIFRLAANESLSNRERRAYIWAMYLLDRIHPAIYRRRIFAEFEDISAGFIADTVEDLGQLYRLERQVSDGSAGYRFGVVVGIREDLEFRYFQGARGNLFPAEVRGFPIIITRRRIALSAPIAPLGVSAACYAQPRTSKQFFGPIWASAILIARHSLANVGYLTGLPVQMANGSVLRVADIDGSTTIDAAFLDCISLPAGLSPLSLAPVVAPGASMSLSFSGGPMLAQVLLVNDHPFYYGNICAHRFFIDVCGNAGDSGALMTHAVSGDSVGIYIGQTNGISPEGIVQSMRQVVKYFDVDLYN